jgi:hypothetical protein
MTWLRSALHDRSIQIALQTPVYRPNEGVHIFEARLSSGL